MKNFIVEYYRDQDHVNVRRQLESSGAIICAVIKVPFWNVYGQQVSNQFVVVYQAKKEIDIEVLW